MRTLLIDNYDSFTYTIAAYLWKANGREPIIIKNDSINLVEVKNLKFDNIVISPGPGTPEKPSDVGLSILIFKDFLTTPILGICLGHQCLAKYFGAQVVNAPLEMHGKYSSVRLSKCSLFNAIPSTIRVVRYHSLIVEKQTLPSSLQVVAVTSDEEELIMGLMHKEKPLFGLQFHPESAGTQSGEQFFLNFKRISENWLSKQVQTEHKTAV